MRSMKNLYNAINNATGNPASPASLKTLSGQTLVDPPSVVSLGNDFTVTNIAYDSATYNVSPGNSLNTTIRWTTTGNFATQIKLSHLYDASSENTNILSLDAQNIYSADWTAPGETGIVVIHIQPNSKLTDWISTLSFDNTAEVTVS